MEKYNIDNKIKRKIANKSNKSNKLEKNLIYKLQVLNY